MKIRPTLYAALAALSLAGCTTNATHNSHEAMKPAAPQFLHTHGQDIVDQSGKPVLLRGVGLGNWTLPEGYMWQFGGAGDRPRKIEKVVSDLTGTEYADTFWKNYRRAYITQADIQRIAALGFNCVRPSLNARLFLSEGDDPQYQAEGFEILDNLLKWCHEAGIYCIVDMHAAPGGQTGANIDDSAHDDPELFSKPEIFEQRLTNLWVKIAERYKNEPAVAAYDLLNEPLPERTGASKKYKDQLEPLYQRLTAAVRKVDMRHMITVEGADWANDWSVFTKPFDDNLFYQYHYYCWDHPTKLKSMQQYIDARDRLNAPIWAGETGESDDTLYWGTTDYMESNNIGWSFWPWKKMVRDNGPYSIKAPADWAKVTAYSQKGEGDKPTQEESQKIFDELLQNVRIENCIYHADVVDALFRRIPGRIQAENYGHLGAGKSYAVTTDENSKLYRVAEPVQVVTLRPMPATTRAATTRNGRRNNGGQAIQLPAGEWTAYHATSDTTRAAAISIRIKAIDGNATLALTLNGVTQELPLTNTDWTELPLKPAAIRKGENKIKLTITTGTAAIDWLDIK